jgi:hypothetical protein
LSYLSGSLFRLRQGKLCQNVMFFAVVKLNLQLIIVYFILQNSYTQCNAIVVLA